MDATEFAIWFAGLALLDLAQRGRVLAALSGSEKQHICTVQPASSSPATERVAESSTEAAVVVEARRRGRERFAENSVAAIGHHKIETSGCPHCASGGIVGWGQSDGLPRYRCKDCRKTFNALTKTPMAGLHKKEQWLDHAEAMIEGRAVQRSLKNVILNMASRPPRAAAKRSCGVVSALLQRRTLKARDRIRAKIPGFFRMREASSRNVTSRV
jgi:transposase-like protein